MNRLPLFLVLAHFAVPVLTAAPEASMDRLREGEAKQQQLRGDAQRLVEQLNGMLDEYARNGFGGDETQTVQALRDGLQRLSTDEMKQVVELLEKARGARDVGEAKQRVSDAYTSQKAILTRMQQLLTEHLRNQQAQELATQLGKLAERQAVNLQNGVSLGQWTGGKKPENFEAAMQANLQGQQAEQTAIAEELKALGQRVAQFAREPENAEQAARFQKGLESIQKVLPNVENAAEALKNGQLFKAVGDEKMARDALRRLAKEIAPPQDRVEALRTAQRELTKAIEDQKEIAKESQKAAGEKDFDRWLDQQIAEKKVGGRLAKAPREQLRNNPALQQRFAAQQQGKADELPALENKQGDVAARSDELAQSLARTAPEVAREVKAGNDKMQETRAAMMDGDGPAAAKNAQDALAAMQAAEAKLQQEVAKAEALAGKSNDPVKDLQALQQQAQALAQQQADVAKNPDKSGQPALAQKIDDLAKRAAAIAPAAAPAAQRAAADAQQAAQAAQAGQPAAAAPAQQAAARNLAQAAQQVAQQAAAAQQAQQQAAAAQQAQQQLAEVIISEQKLQLETAKSVAQATPGTPVPRGAFSGQASRQQEISVRTETLQTTLTPDLAAASPSLREALGQMREAKQHLEKPDGKLAQTAEQKALDFLYAAQAALQQAAAQAQAALGQNPNPPQNPGAQQQAAAQLAQAQAAVANANQALQQAQQAQAAAQAAQAAGQQAQQAAQQAQQAGNQPAAAQAQQQAQQAGQQAAAQQAAAQRAAQQAAAQLGQAAAQAGQAAAQAQPANSPAQQGAQAAAQAATQGAAQAAAQNIPGAQAQAAAAQQALAQAQAAMAQAQAGVTAANPMGGMPGMPGQSGPPGSQPGQQPGKTPGQTPGQPSSPAAEKYQPAGNEAAQMGSRTVANRKAVFTSLPARERAVIEQAQSEKYPEEYGTQVEQYLLNLARESAAKK